MPDNEPALLVAFEQAVAKGVLAIVAAAGLSISDQESAALTVAIAGVVSVLFSVLQGYLTRRKVWSPASVEAVAPGATTAPAEVYPTNR